jgi:signal-transduction protein with cAMP-binding, CBS, and nucleotidyltransferase domain
MLARDLKHVPVVRDGKPVGMLARHDLLKLIATPPP